MSRKIAFKIAKNLTFLFVGVGLLYLAFKGNDLSLLIEDLKNARYGWVMLSMTLGIVAFISRAIRWRILLSPMGYHPRITTSVYSIIIGYLANLALPRIGEITRCTVMSQAENIPVDKLFGTVILERIIDMFLLMSATTIVILLKVDLFGGFFLNLLTSNSEKFPDLFMYLSVLTGIGVIFLAILYFMRQQLLRLTFVRKIREFFLGLKEGLVSVRKINNKGGFFFHTFLIWFCYYLMTWVVFYAIEDTAVLGWIDAMFILVVGGFGMAAPVQGGIGAYHLIVSMGLGVLGIAQGPALSYATIVHASQTLVVLVTGLISMILLYLSKKKLKTDFPVK